MCDLDFLLVFSVLRARLDLAVQKARRSVAELIDWFMMGGFS
jgi:hypothetical protein